MAIARVAICVACFLEFPTAITRAASNAPPAPQGEMAGLPSAVQAEVGAQLCQGDGPPTFEPGFVTRRNILGNGNVDIVLNYTHVACKGFGFGLAYCGSGGCQTQVFVKVSSGSEYTKVFDESVKRITFGRAHGMPAISIIVSGIACEKDNATPCGETLYWNGSKFTPFYLVR